MNVLTWTEAVRITRGESIAPRVIRYRARRLQMEPVTMIRRRITTQGGARRALVATGQAKPEATAYELIGRWYGARVTVGTADTQSQTGWALDTRHTVWPR